MAVMGLIGTAVRGSAVAVIAGVLVFAVPITSEALVPAPLIPTLVATLAGGGGEGMAAGAGASAVCATGVGCAVLAGAAVGIGLYMTRDTWVPWVTNAFGGGSPSSSPGSGPAVYPMSLSFAHEVTAPNATIDIAYNATGAWCGAGCGDSYSVAGQLQCQNPAGGGVVTRALSGGTGFIARSYTGTLNQLNGQTIGCGTADYTGSSGGAGSTVKAFWITWTAPQSGDVSNRLEYGGSFDVASAGVQARVSCENPDGSTYEVVGTQLVDGLVEMPTCVGANGSSAGAHGKCVTLLAGPSGGSLVEQSSTCGAVAGLRATYPNCVGPGVSACTYVVRVDGLACTVGASSCVDWARTALEDPSRVSCRWGPYTVPLSSCAMLERIYEVQTEPLPATELNTDGKPETYTAPGPQGQTQNQPVPDPAPAPPPAPQPQPLPDQTPGTIGSPNGPSTAVERECWPSGWGLFNPASWVLQPAKCALAWAFVPRTAVLTGMAGGVKSDLARVGIAPIASAVGTNLGMIGTGSGCEGPSVTFSAVGIVKPMHPFSACDSPMSTLAAISRAVSTVAIVAVGGFGALRAIGAGFGFNVSMGNGKAES